MADFEKRNIQVHIYGKDYNLASQQDSAYVEKIAQRVDTLMKDIGRGKISDINCSILASMTLADELNKMEDEVLLIREEMEENEKRLLDILRVLDKGIESGAVSEINSDAEINSAPEIESAAEINSAVDKDTGEFPVFETDYE